jgi:hypothetical protein
MLTLRAETRWQFIFVATSSKRSSHFLLRRNDQIVSKALLIARVCPPD